MKILRSFVNFKHVLMYGPLFVLKSVSVRKLDSTCENEGVNAYRLSAGQTWYAQLIVGIGLTFLPLIFYLALQESKTEKNLKYFWIGLCFLLYLFLLIFTIVELRNYIKRFTKFQNFEKQRLNQILLLIVVIPQLCFCLITGIKFFNFRILTKIIYSVETPTKINFSIGNIFNWKVPEEINVPLAAEAVFIVVLISAAYMVFACFWQMKSKSFRLPHLYQEINQRHFASRQRFENISKLSNTHWRNVWRDVSSWTRQIVLYETLMLLFPNNNSRWFMPYRAFTWYFAPQFFPLVLLLILPVFKYFVCSNVTPSNAVMVACVFSWASWAFASSVYNIKRDFFNNFQLVGAVNVKLVVLKS